MYFQLTSNSIMNLCISCKHGDSQSIDNKLFLNYTLRTISFIVPLYILFEMMENFYHCNNVFGKGKASKARNCTKIEFCVQKKRMLSPTTF